ncbi:mRNA splicing protein Prp28 [Malassezia pachydermatis]|uniref:RNA helicase n=1 Tax=Malassezia pachydermatis TaxID=77020 RepID=A0A0N0RS52_9BASI|nr:pre-mrna-splicing atp-dependent rna helicase prp28 [Malassezia pachydermatis]KOS13845.1 pre-mrna-splicing atp-dependent rna helicase prp28 [Malassezia pachydermatis]
MPPLSVQELLAQRAQQGQGDVRPKFVSKREREAHKQAEQKAEKEKEAALHARLKRARVEWESQASTASTSSSPAHESEDEHKEAQLIKQRYLGTRPSSVPRRQRRAGDAHAKRFQFEWSAEDDTSDPTLATLPESSAVLRGRAGLDGSERSESGRSRMRATLAEKPWSEKTLEEMRARDWRIFREDFQIQVRGGGDIPYPLRSWKESAIPSAVLEAIDTMGYREPTPIQRQAIPIGLLPRDLIGIAETGSGKTASFVVPMLAHCMRQPPMNDDTRHMGPHALILAPTRELAQQIEGETRKFASRLGCQVVSLVGGRDLTEQAFHLSEGAEIVIATPGRLQDCLERHTLVLSQCHFLVMDEADRMVDMNYEDALHYILACLPSAEHGRTTMLYSATMPPTVERIARTYLQNPATVVIGQAGQAVGTVEQRVEFVDSDEQRTKRLLQVLDSGFAPPMIVFVNQKAHVDVVSRDLRRAGWHVAMLHSGLSQPQREASIESLRDGRNEVLCCTDIGARGIDLPDVSLVVNVHFPTNFPSYIHRIGRTGRAGKKGCAMTFIDENDAEHFYELRQALSKSPLSRVPTELAQHPAALQRPARATSDGAK